ncbi:MAG: hypothetical protein WDN04_07780 [Rhodospirillales bacterium]
MLLPSWQIVCHINDIPQQGDYITFDLGPDSVVALRDREGRDPGLSQCVPPPRGPPAGGCRRLSWLDHLSLPRLTYNLDGSLRGTPVRESFPNLDRAEHGLLKVRMEIMAGFVFVCLAGDPPTPASMWGDMLDDFAPYSSRRCSRWRPCTTKIGTWTGRWQWTTTSNPTTCRSAIPAFRACSRRITMTS